MRLYGEKLVFWVLMLALRLALRFQFLLANAYGLRRFYWVFGMFIEVNVIV